jgi:hypothetical protein
MSAAVIRGPAESELSHEFDGVGRSSDAAKHRNTVAIACQPSDGNIVPGHVRVRREDCQTFRLRLSHTYPIERVAMVPGQIEEPAEVTLLQGEPSDRVGGHLSVYRSFPVGGETPPGGSPSGLVFLPLNPFFEPETEPFA